MLTLHIADSVLARGAFHSVNLCEYSLNSYSTTRLVVPTMHLYYDLAITTTTRVAGSYTVYDYSAIVPTISQRPPQLTLSPRNPLSVCCTVVCVVRIRTIIVFLARETAPRRRVSMLYAVLKRVETVLTSISVSPKHFRHTNIVHFRPI